MVKPFLNPSTIATPRGFTYAVTATGEKRGFISGQAAFNVKGDLVGKGDRRAQTQQVYENLKNALAAAGATTADAVKLNPYVMDFKPADLAAIREVRAQYFPNPEQMPASALVGVQALAFEGLLIEVEAVAMGKE